MNLAEHSWRNRGADLSDEMVLSVSMHWNQLPSLRFVATEASHDL